ncbi:hypothetical protein BOTNAR_0023g00360 [Botryotinia narcissicola]|uniref:Myb-like DNA-binding domain-containing protein n=1 Tax=Botryotinia narcissicola TaxID=278944 RepID=A0A4Z1JHU0_9HELO|nr:hypothetical protein BOTNAR_0023g00360 [Botryotinia narcissicola]
MPSKIQLDENLKSDMKTIDFAAVGQTTNLKSPAARMRYTRLKRQIEKGVIGANANINLGSGKSEGDRNGEEKERRKEKREKKMREKKMREKKMREKKMREKKMREKKQKEEKREREGVEKKEKVEVKEWNRVEGGMGMEMGMEMYDGVEKKEGKRKREIRDTTESDADAISEPDFHLQGWKTSILNNTTSLFPADPPQSIQFSTHPHTEYPSHPYLHNYPATTAPQPNIPQSNFSASQSISQTHPDQLPFQTSSSPPLDPQIKLEPYSPFSSFSSYSTERSLPNLHERIEDEDADSEDEMPLAKRRGLGKRHASRSQSPHRNGNPNSNPNREEISQTNTSKIAEGYGDAHSHSHSHSCSEMSDLRESGCVDEYTYTHPPLRSSIHELGTSSQYAYAYPNPYTTPYKSIYAPPASSYDTLESLNSTLLAPLPSPLPSPSPSPPSKSTSTPFNPHPYNWADTYKSYRHLWGTERIARVSPPPPPPPSPPPPSLSTSSSSPLSLYHNHNHNHNYNHNYTHTHTHTPTHNHNKITNANTIPDSDFPAPLPTQSPRSNTHPLSLSQW